MPKAQLANANINTMLSDSNGKANSPTTATINIHSDTLKEKLPDVIAIPSVAPIPTVHDTRRHSITLDLDDLALLKKDLGNKAYILLLLLMEFGVDKMLSSHKQEVDIFAFAKRYDINPEDVHKGMISIKNLSIAGNQLKIPFVYDPRSDEG